MTNENLRVLSVTHDDNDGIMSAVVILDAYKNHEVKVVKYTHDKAEESIKNACEVAKEFKPDIIYITDLPYIEELEEFCESIHWIDHHASSIDKSKFKHVHGIRSVSMSGCELTWMYLNNESGKNYVSEYNELERADDTINIERDKAPMMIKYIGDRDNWDHRLNNTVFFNSAFNTALVALNVFEEPENFKKILRLYNDSNPEVLFNEIVTTGRYYREYDEERWKVLCDKITTTAPFKIKGMDDKYRVGYIMYSEASTSEIFDSVKNDYDIGVVYRITPDLSTISVSLYSIDTSIDVSVIAKQNGGGGHKGASGFSKPLR